MSGSPTGTMIRKRLLVIYSTHQALHWFSVGVLAPILALVQLAKGLDLFQIGLNVALYSGSVVILELPTGGLADAIGRKRVYLYSLLAKFVSIGVLLFAGSAPTFMAGFVGLGISRALSSGSMDAWFVDEYNRVGSDGNLQRALAVVGIYIPLSLGLGSAVGGLLPDTLGIAVSSVNSFDIYSSNLLIILLFVVIQFLFTAIVVKEHRVRRERYGPAMLYKQLPNILSTSIRYGLKNKVVLMLLIPTAGIGVALAGLENFWQPRVRELVGPSSKTWIFGVLSAAYFLSASVGSVFITPICRVFRNNYAVILFATKVAMGFIWLLVASQSSIAGFSVFYVALFLFNGFSNSPHAAILNAQIPESKRSTLLSFESLVLQIGVIVGSLVLGYISKVISIPAAWRIGAVILIATSVSYLFINKSEYTTGES